tara:strand:- start:52 stop:753 length:702 start_codon:yes stop_codon:yes gene_type:complete
MKKKQIEIALIVLLILLMYLQSSLLNTFSKSVLGKAAMIFAIIYITQNFGRNAGILSALIMILNLYNAEKTEGFDVKEKKPDQKAQKSQKPQDTNANKIQKEQQIEKRAQELSKKKPAADLQSYVEEADGDGIPDPETWMSPESLAKFKAYVRKIKKKRDAEVTTQAIAEDKSEDNKEEKKLQEAFINQMLAPKSIQGIDRQLKKVAEYNKIAVTSQGNEFASGKFGYVKRPF